MMGLFIVEWLAGCGQDQVRKAIELRSGQQVETKRSGSLDPSSLAGGGAGCPLLVTGPQDPVYCGYTLSLFVPHGPTSPAQSFGMAQPGGFHRTGGGSLC